MNVVPCVNGPLDGDGILFKRGSRVPPVVRCGVKARRDYVGPNEITVVLAAPHKGAPVVHRYTLCDHGHLHYEGVE